MSSMTDTATLTHILYDEDSGLSYVWSGVSHTVSVYSELSLPATYDKPNGVEVDVFSVGDFANDRATVEEFVAGVALRIAEDRESNPDYDSDGNKTH